MHFETSSSPARLGRVAVVAVALLSLSGPAAARTTLPGCDFNGDGYDDLAAGIPWEDEGLPNGAGAVQVIYGSAGGLTTTGNQLWHQNSDSVKDSAEEPPVFGPWENFGSTVDCGDYDGDGYDDLAVSVPGETFPHTTHRGAVHILPGGAAGLHATGDQLFDMGDIPGHSEAFTTGFGTGLASADFDGDGRDDLAIGVTDAGDGGMVVVLHGGDFGLTTLGSQIWEQDNPWIWGSSALPEAFGASLVSGDFDDDGYADLAVASPLESSTAFWAGGVNVLQGGPAGLNIVGNQYWDQNSAWIVGVPEISDLCGQGLASGDFDGDGHDDLAFGCPGEGFVSNHSDWGVLHIVYGCDTGLCSDDPGYINQNTLGLAGTAAQGDLFASALVAGDFNGNGTYDLAVGVPGETVDAGGHEDAGAVHVLYGGSRGLFSSADLFYQSQPGLVGSGQAYDRFGEYLGTGDYNGDGNSDLAIAVPGDNPSGQGGGAVQVLYGGNAGVSAVGSERWHQDVDGIEGSQDAGSRFGHLGDDPESAY